MKYLAFLSCALALVACKFNSGGVAGGNGDDGGGGTIDSRIGDDAENPPDSTPGAPDATPPPDADNDSDDDTIPNATDNCPSIANTDQHDEDSDTVGDVCDNCPGVSNTTQANTTEPVGVTGDTVGDACDPHPLTADVIAFFDPFKGTGAPSGWTVLGGTWTQAGDKLGQSTTTGPAIIYRTDVTGSELTWVTAIQVDDVPPSPGPGGQQLRAIGGLDFYTPGTTFGTGYLCEVLDDLNDNSTAVVYVARHANDGNSSSPNLTALPDALQAGQTYVVQEDASATAVSCSVLTTPPVTAAKSDSTFTTGSIALRTNRVGASYRYVVVFAPAP